VPLSVYEMNLSTLSGRITQSALNGYVSSLGAGLAVVDAMLQLMRHGVLLQNLWNLSQYDFVRPDKHTAHLWGAVIDMGVTDLRRPQYLALQLANQAIGSGASMLETVQSGSDPRWNQPLVNTVELPRAHYLQSFAFSRGSTYSIVVFNLHRTESLRVAFGGAHAPSGAVVRQELTSASPRDTNESSEVVRINQQAIDDFSASSQISLPPYSMTSLTWTETQ
jgi:hypothetical protein